jgi:hypothetical protein
VHPPELEWVGWASPLEDVMPRRNGLIVMLKVYLDLGTKRDQNDGIMTLASVIFKPTKYKQFIRPWNRMLADWKASAFHATDFYSGAQEFKRDSQVRKELFEEDSKRIPEMIGRHIQRILLISFRPEEFNRIALPQWKEKFGTSIHSHAVQLCLIANAYWQQETYRYEKLAYFMESGDTDEGEVLKTVARMRQDNGSKTAQVISSISSFTAVDKGIERGLEAADFAAWHWNKHYMDKIREGRENEPRKDFAAFVHASEHKIDQIFATGAKLKFLFSVVPREVLEGSV